MFQDENRFATKGAHLNLKRAEKARAAIAKLPGIFLPSFLIVWYRSLMLCLMSVFERMRVLFRSCP